MGFLEQEGFESLKRKAQRYVRDAVNDIKDAVLSVNNHITTELELLRTEMRTGMADITASVDRAIGAFQTELAQVRAEAQANLDAANAALAAASADNVELTAALQAEVDRSTALLGTVDTAAGKLDTLSAELEANDPVVEPPVEPAPVDPEPEPAPVEPEVPVEPAPEV